MIVFVPAAEGPAAASAASRDTREHAQVGKRGKGTPRHFTTAHQRSAGRQRAAQFTRGYQSAAGKKRAAQPSFVHLQTIAPDGFWSWSAYLRGPSGLRLLTPNQIEFLRPEQLRGPQGVALSPREQRLLFGLYCFKAVYDGLPWPPLPTDETFLAEVEQVQAIVGHGQPLAHPLDAISAAPNDFCDASGVPWSFRTQRKLFREALQVARVYAQEQARNASLTREQSAPAPCLPWQPGRRRPLQIGTTPAFQRRPHTRDKKFCYGRPDLPSFDPENILPTRPFRAASSSNRAPTFWLAPDTSGAEEEQGWEEV